MQHLEVSRAVRPLKWSLGVKWLTVFMFAPCINVIKALVDARCKHEYRIVVFTTWRSDPNFDNKMFILSDSAREELL